MYALPSKRKFTCSDVLIEHDAPEEHILSNNDLLLPLCTMGLLPNIPEACTRNIVQLPMRDLTSLAVDDHWQVCCE